MGRSREGSELVSAYDGGSLLFRNRIINGDMRIWQRGTSFTAEGGAYTADRWAFLTNGTGGTTTVSQGTTNLPNKSFSSKLSMALSGSSRTGVTAWGIRQLIEMANIYDMYNGGTWTASFWYRSNRTGTHYARVDNSVGGGSAGGGQIIGSFTVNAADTWEFKTVNFTFTALTTVPTSAINTAGSLLDIGPTVGGSGPTSLSSGDYFEVTGVQLEAGAVATPFERRPYGTELALCQRYYQVLTGSVVGAAQSATIFTGTIVFPVLMRATPSPSLSAAYRVSDITSNSYTQSAADVSASLLKSDGGTLSFGNFTGMTTGRVTIAANNSSGNLLLSSEL